jgi:hypothetical protein
MGHSEQQQSRAEALRRSELPSHDAASEEITSQQTAEPFSIGRFWLEATSD